MTNSEAKSISRHELYDMVWAKPLTKIAPQFGLSDVGLAKVCDRHEIPRPPVGHWAKLAHGKAGEKTPLPKLDDEDLEEIRVFRKQFFEADKPKADKRKQPRVVVASTLGDAHPAVRKTASKSARSKPNEKGLVPISIQGCLRVAVSPEQVDRAMRIFDAIIKAWIEEGGTFDRQSCSFELDNRSVSVGMSEKTRRFEINSEKRDPIWDSREWGYETTGKLALEIDQYGDGLRKTWADGSVQRLEDVLGNFIATLHDWMVYLKQREIDMECEKRQRAKAEKMRHRKRELVEFENARRKELQEFVEAWEKSERIRAYLSAVEKEIASDNVAPSSPETFGKWMEWAHWYADHLCPITQTPVRNDREPPTNCSIEELDLTRATREFLMASPWSDTDELFRISRGEFLDEYGYQKLSVRNEIELVLTGLGYDVDD